jgi:tetratricopeptide (TPR) repeat protein
MDVIIRLAHFILALEQVMNRQLSAQGLTISAFLSLLAVFPNPAMAQPKSTCEQGPNSGRISACNELLGQEQSPAKLAVIYRNRAQAYSWSGQYDLAATDYDAALGIDPKDAEALYGRGWAFENMQKYDLAVADADSLLAMGEKANKFAVNQLRCRALAALARFSEAIDACSQQLRPYASEIFLVDRGEAYLAAGQYDRAVEDFDAALKIDAHAALAKLGRGKAMFAKKNYAMALEEFEQANQMMEAPSGQPWPVALSKRGLANEALGRRSAAIVDFQKALSRQSNLDESKEGLKRLGASPATSNRKSWWRFW